ncbi:tripartite tricarboxylate transporter permease [Halomonas sp. McH1-25]|uniref:tripartite tricarboxylate transporter permease n=1 Tax=unclassified Halomonas TaxID=2609666 RepID=UPI001EF69630|nr:MULTISPECIES: tripartite tricarboxylate transporter permease [unclassified Halomonas]MCG7599733.1 tripartite tricarboxylate transporter permease [Halomonas sp. McH1-25]MCP1342817.1 tripartite tricarboxylate transporter permease [Halomonas sp. FL8]MCP1360887.1 tripartite tricarboxylate transporter permease [Halomonas sp. BBD45]
MEVLQEALGLVLDWQVLAVILGASIFGLFIGAIPGLTATMATALLVPVTFFMDPLPAIGAIVSATAMAIVAGDIPGALLRIPGTPASAAYTDEAYLMGRQGRIGQALGVNLVCSVIGGVIGVAILAFFAPLVAEFAIQFTSDEYFWLALLGLSCAVLVSGSDPLKGAISMLLGLLISMVGMSSVSGQMRFIFGIPELLSGISILPVLIGLFAVAELLRRMPEIGRVSLPTPPSVKKTFEGVGGILWKYKGGMARSGMLGTLIGALPGAGADIASWISYALARKLSRTPEKFGTGHPEGLVSASSANNAALSGAYIPALVFGIPGDTITAIIIGVLMMKGVTPGPDVFTTDAALVNAIFIVFLLANLLLLPLGLVAVRGARHILSVPSGVLYPLILLFCIVGAYATNNSMLDIWLMLGLGLLAYVMAENDFPIGPMILAVILGPIVEGNFLRSMIKANGDLLMLFDRPIAATLGILALLVWVAIIVSTLWSVRHASRKATPTQSG